MVKVCPQCSETRVVKNGRQRGKQAYICGLCKHRFVNKSRRKRKDALALGLRSEYIIGKQTYQQIGNKIGRNKRTIQRIFDREIIRTDEFYNERLDKRAIYVICDCTRFGDTCFIVIKSHEHKKVVYAKALEGDENVRAYVDALSYLINRGRLIRGIVCDGFSGLRQAFVGLPFQLCQFHQVKNIIKYITKKPKHIAGRSLLDIVYKLKNSNYQEFSDMIQQRYQCYQEHINEKSYSTDTGKRRRWYTHKRLRSAYRSIQKNMSVLFTYTVYDDMPNTTNELDGYFKLIKAKVNIHNGLQEERKKKVILSLFAA